MTRRFIVLAALACVILSTDGEAQTQCDKTGEWDYEGATTGPSCWGEIEGENDPLLNAACKPDVNRGQSPRTFVLSREPEEPDPIVTTRNNTRWLDYPPLSFNVERVHHTVKATAPKSAPFGRFNFGMTPYPDCSAYQLGPVPSTKPPFYNLVQIHFHSPSEHRLRGKYELEAHLVHESADTNKYPAVLAVFFVVGAENEFLKTLLANVPDLGKETKGVTLNPGQLLPGDLSLLRYCGSLTTPPCTGGVNWHVFFTPVTATAAQIKGMKDALVKENARPTQPWPRMWRPYESSIYR